MSAPLNGRPNERKMNNRQASNEFNTNIRQNFVLKNIPQSGTSDGNAPNIPQQFNHFNRPYLAPSSRFPNKAGEPRFIPPYKAEIPAHNVNQLPPRLHHTSDMPNMGGLTNNIQVPSPSFQKPGFFSPSTFGNTNVPLIAYNQPFNPNIPPPAMQPLQTTFRSPPPSIVAQPRQPLDGINQHPRAFYPLNIQQTNTHTRFPPPLDTNKHILAKDLIVKDQLEKMRESCQKMEDEKWIMNLTQSKQNMSNVLKKPTHAVSEAQEKTRYLMILLARLQKGKQNLESMKNDERTVWEHKLKEVMHLKRELETLQSDLTNEETVETLKRKVERTRKKRERIKRKRLMKHERVKEQLLHREEVNVEIDKKMQRVIEQQRLKKQEEDLKKEADQILGQVRKKISDANKSRQLLNSIQKLRSLRKDRLARQGILSMYERDGERLTKSLILETKVTDMVMLLNKQLDTYKSEEEALKVILETEQEETREKEREKAKQKQMEKLKQEKVAEQNMLFGNQKAPKPGDPLYPFWQYYTAAETSLETLILIRQEWDMYLALPHTPGASCIPHDWVIPPEPSSDIWNTALQDDVP